MKTLRRFVNKSHNLIVCKLIQYNEKYYWIRDEDIQLGRNRGFRLKENCDHIPIVRDRIISTTTSTYNILFGSKYFNHSPYCVHFLESDITDVYFPSDQVDDQQHS